VFISGPAGQLESSFDQVEDSDGIAILCHPHPQYGGSMHDNVLSMLSAAFQQQAISSLKFNFRGVGESEGEYADGLGEVEDTLAITNWCRDQHPQAGIYLCGYSFGAIMALKALSQLRPQLGESSYLKGSVLVAPPVQMLSESPGIECPTLVILGADDMIVPLESASAQFEDCLVQVIQGADHFFFNHDQQIIKGTRDFIDGT